MESVDDDSECVGPMVTKDFELLARHNRWQLKDKIQKKSWEQR